MGTVEQRKLHGQLTDDYYYYFYHDNYDMMMMMMMITDFFFFNKIAIQGTPQMAVD